MLPRGGDCGSLHRAPRSPRGALSYTFLSVPSQTPSLQDRRAPRSPPSPLSRGYRRRERCEKELVASMSRVRRKAPNPKFQIPKKHQIPNLKDQNNHSHIWCLEFEILLLLDAWNLVLFLSYSIDSPHPAT